MERGFIVFLIFGVGFLFAAIPASAGSADINGDGKVDPADFALLKSF